MQTNSSHIQDARPTDIRRRLRTRSGAVTYTLRLLAQTMLRKRRYLTGSTVVLVGFSENADPAIRSAKEEIVSTLQRHGARVRMLPGPARNRAAYRSDLRRALSNVDAVLLDTDSPFFRALRPKEIRELGVEIVIPTSLRT